jgi:hypothetical protein
VSDRGRLSDDAFDHYVALGPGRSYDAVARHYGVSKRAVAKKAAAEGWQERLAGLSKEARDLADAALVQAMQEVQAREAERMRRAREAIAEVMTPARIKAVLATMLKAVLDGGSVRAAALLLDRTLGRARSEPIPAIALDLADGLETAADVKTAANAILQAVADGTLAPEDAQRLSTVLEGARKAVETQDIEQRVTAIEEDRKREARR